MVVVCSAQVATTASTAPEEVAAAAARADAEREAYDRLKQGLWRWSLATTAACFGVTYAFYSRVRARHACASCLNLPRAALFAMAVAVEGRAAGTDRPQHVALLAACISGLL